MKRFMYRARMLMTDIMPRVEVEEVAMIFHGGRLIPLCSVHELGGYESPDAYCHYRIIKWMGKGWCPMRLDDPYQKVKQNVKETKTQQRKDKG